MVASSGRGPSAVFVEGCKGAQGRVEALDARVAQVNQFEGRDPFFSYEPGLLDGGGECEFGFVHRSF